jgi:hypothetical protein
MKDDGYNEQLLTRYLLGNLPEEERIQVEGELLSDDQSYERILVLEDELFYDYALNKLSPGERKQFEKRFLSSEENRKRAILYSNVANKISETTPAGTAEKKIAGRESQHFRRHLKSYFVAQSAAMRVSLVALAIVSLALIWLVIGIVRLRNEINQFGAQMAVQNDQLRQQANHERARADELNLKLKREKDESAMMRQELSKMQAQPDGQRQRAPSLISLALAPSIVREQAPDMKKLYLPSGARLLKLLLKLKEKAEYKSYQVILLTVEGVKIWSQDMLQVQGTGSGRSIELWLPSRTLAPGDYQLKLNGYASDGTLEKTRDYYYLSIRK